MGTMEGWRKAYGAIKDTTIVSLAKVNSEFKELDVAIVKATNHVECPPKERHVRKIFMATSAVRPRADVAYCINALAKRLAKTHTWTVALKTLVVIHRTLREGDPTFREELLNFSYRGHILNLSNFKDDSSPIAWDCSAWVRAYALFLEERLECFRLLKYDIEAERLSSKESNGHEKGLTKMRESDTDTLFEQLPCLQQLLYRLVGCKPEGAAVGKYLIQYALALVLKESFKIYCAINDGIINLVDKYFEMPRHEAIKALEIYKRANHQAESLSCFYDACKALELARNFQFPSLNQPPKNFLKTMEEYVGDAPQIVSVPKKTLEVHERLLLTNKPDETPPSEEKNDENKPSEVEAATSETKAQVDPIIPATVADTAAETGDLLDLSEPHANATALEESNALALAIVTSGSATTAVGASNGGASMGLDGNGWELALVDSSANNMGQIESKLAGGLDKLTLDSLYEDAAARQTPYSMHTYGMPQPGNNPFESHSVSSSGVYDPFAMSNNIPPPPSVQMAAMAQQQQAMTLYQDPQNNAPIVQTTIPGSQANPFGDLFGINLAQNNAGTVPQSHAHNPFGSSGLL